MAKFSNFVQFTFNSRGMHFPLACEKFSVAIRKPVLEIKRYFYAASPYVVLPSFSAVLPYLVNLD